MKKKIQHQIEKTKKIKNIKEEAAIWTKKLKNHELFLKQQDEKKKEEIQMLHKKNKFTPKQKIEEIQKLKKLKAEKIREEKIKLKEKSVNLKQKEFEKKRNNYLKKY